ncbi:hypothetical protein Pcinc_008510 [Petrolisthes cinctipes]|uniref:Uncharacterized protein n=1 Tax=Petrolisthes cinctipes TaxID=88211 RepID=A0AAE1KX76_PETCI|nr:hypothetical protein Pcinc_008510 [Petrolisthes cinctipes]
MFSHPPSPSSSSLGRPFIWTPQPTSLPRIDPHWFIAAVWLGAWTERWTTETAATDSTTVLARTTTPDITIGYFV